MQHWGVPRLSTPQQLQLCPSFPSFTSFHCNSSKHASTRGSSDGPLIFYGWSSCNREYGMKKRCTGLKPLTADPYRRDRLPLFALVTFPHLFPPPSSLPSTLIPHSGSAFVTTQKGCILWPVPRQYLQAHSLPCTGLRKLTAIGTVRCPFPRKGKGGAATQAQASNRGRSVKALAWCAVYISFPRPNRPRWRGNISAVRLLGKRASRESVGTNALGDEVTLEAKLTASNEPSPLPSQSGISKFL